MVVVAGRYDVGLFRAAYPAGWRVITAPADAPPFVIFVAPDNCALVALSVEPLDAPAIPAACGPARGLSRRAGGDTPIYAAGRAAAAGWTTFLTRFEQIVAGVKS